VAHSLRVRFNTRYLWIGLDWIRCKLWTSRLDRIWLDQQKWTHAQLCVKIGTPNLNNYHL